MCRTLGALGAFGAGMIQGLGGRCISQGLGDRDVGEAIARLRPAVERCQEKGFFRPRSVDPLREWFYLLQRPFVHASGPICLWDVYVLALLGHDRALSALREWLWPVARREPEGVHDMEPLALLEPLARTGDHQAIARLADLTVRLVGDVGPADEGEAAQAVLSVVALVSKDNAALSAIYRQSMGEYVARVYARARPGSPLALTIALQGVRLGRAECWSEVEHFLSDGPRLVQHWAADFIRAPNWLEYAFRDGFELSRENGRRLDSAVARRWIEALGRDPTRAAMLRDWALPRPSVVFEPPAPHEERRALARLRRRLDELNDQLASELETASPIQRAWFMGRLQVFDEADSIASAHPKLLERHTRALLRIVRALSSTGHANLAAALSDSRVFGVLPRTTVLALCRECAGAARSPTERLAAVRMNAIAALRGHPTESWLRRAGHDDDPFIAMHAVTALNVLRLPATARARLRI
jgi:hypothetical protein